MFNLSKIWKNFVCDQRIKLLGICYSVECFQKMGDKLMVSGVVIDLNRMEGYSTCLSPLGFLDALAKPINSMIAFLGQA